MKPGDRSYRFTAFLFRRVFFRITVEGAENEPTDGPVLLCANHISDADPILLSAVRAVSPGLWQSRSCFRSRS